MRKMLLVVVLIASVACLNANAEGTGAMAGILTNAAYKPLRSIGTGFRIGHGQLGVVQYTRGLTGGPGQAPIIELVFAEGENVPESITCGGVPYNLVTGVLFGFPI